MLKTFIGASIASVGVAWSASRVCLVNQTDFELYWEMQNLTNGGFSSPTPLQIPGQTLCMEMSTMTGLFSRNLVRVNVYSTDGTESGGDKILHYKPNPTSTSTFVCTGSS